MKQRRIIISVAALLGLALSTGCQKEMEAPDGEMNLREMTFHAGWSDETKTVLQDDGKSIYWAPGDEISVFVGSGVGGGYKFTSKGKEEAATTTFEGSLNGNAGTYYALYPYDANAQCSSDGYIYTAIPSEQTAKDGTFADGALISVAVSKNDNLNFKNVCSGIKFSVTHDNINKIIVKSRTGGSLAGRIGIIALENDNPTSFFTEGTSTITVTAPKGGCFSAGTYYYISICVVKNESIDIEYYTTDNKVATKSILTSVDFHRGVVKRLVEADKNLLFYTIHNSTAGISSDNFLPVGVDKTTITDVNFMVNSSKTTETPISSVGEPVYFELEGTTANYYTAAEVYDLLNANSMFEGWSSLKQLDLSNVDTKHTTGMRSMFERCKSLKSINFGEFCTENVTTMSGMFANCWSLESLDLSGFRTSKVNDMESMFAGCTSITTLDLSSFDTSNVMFMSGMFGSRMNSLEVFQGPLGCSSLKSLDLHTLNTSNVTSLSAMFFECSSLKTVNLLGWDTSNVESLSLMFSGCISLESVDLSSFDTKKVTSMLRVFEDCTSLKSLNLSNFNTSNVASMQSMFWGCESLQDLDISSFDASSLTDMSQFLNGTSKIKKLNLGTFDISLISSLDGLASRSKGVAIRCTDSAKGKIEGLSDGTYFNADYVTWVGLDETMPDLPDYKDPSMYYSVDFSKDKTVEKLQTASIGKGVDVVIMGDAYSDKLIADGTYKKDMEDAVAAVFSIEPMKSYKDYFNVYMVYAVSENEVYTGSTVFETSGEVGNSVTSNAYAKIAVHDKPLSDIATIVIVHDTDAFSGVLGATWTFFSIGADDYYDYGQAQQSIAFVGRWADDNVYSNTVAHEFGHMFAKLADEYVTKDETISQSEIDDLNYLALHAGAYKNIDFTNIIESIKWNKFIKDSRYSNENLGAYEGGHLYSQGVWRPNYNSIMRDGTLYNAPSREAIYYRIHKLAYGDSWTYDYETFVQKDLENIPAAKPAAMAKASSSEILSKAKHYFKMTKSKSLDGRELITVIMD